MAAVGESGTEDAPRLVYCPCPDEAAARTIAAALVGERLAACVNIVPRIVSVYRWQGSVAEDAEALLLAKTRASLAPAVMARIAALHPYDVPAMAVLATDGTTEATLAWLRAETGG